MPARWLPYVLWAARDNCWSSKETTVRCTHDHFLRSQRSTGRSHRDELRGGSHLHADIGPGRTYAVDP